MVATVNSTGTSTGVVITPDSSGVLALQTGGTTAITVDTSQNVGIGVTPSAWSGFRALQVGGTTSIWSSTSGNGSSFYSNNIYYNGTNRIYTTTGYATEYIQDSSAGSHIWFTAPSGTVGGTVTTTERMRIDSSGNLLVGTTSNVTGGKVNIAQGSSDGTMYQMMQLTAGSGTGGNEVGQIKRQTTASVANSAITILNSMTFGELITVAGTGSGAIFADLLMASYNTVAVISSNTQQGGPASRTYSVSSGALRLTMGSATAMSITVQSLISGARGA